MPQGRLCQNMFPFPLFLLIICTTILTRFNFNGALGLDLNCGDYLSTYTEGAIAMGKVKEANVDVAVSNLFMVQKRLGMFDGNPKKQPFGSIGVKDVCSAAHQELAVEAARQGIVLLKNEGNTLPLSRSKRVAIIGPNANATHVMLGDYEGIMDI